MNHCISIDRKLQKDHATYVYSYADCISDGLFQYLLIMCMVHQCVHWGSTSQPADCKAVENVILQKVNDFVNVY